MAFQIKRDQASILRSSLSCLFTGGIGIYFLVSFRSTGSTYDIVCGLLFTAWAAYMLWLLITVRVVFQETETGLVMRTGFGFTAIRWDQLVAIGDPTASQRIFLLVWKDTGDAPDRFAAGSVRMFGPENIKDMHAFILSRRPDLPTYTPD